MPRCATQSNTAATDHAAIQATPTRVIACGALAVELVELKKANQWDQLDITCLPAKLHHHPQEITPHVKQAIDEARAEGFEQILIGYGDCGTGGHLDMLLEQEKNVARLPGAHCYEFFATTPVFDALAEEELGTFYLTDFLARHFDFFVWRMLGLDRKPELLEMYFEHYKKVVYLAQTHDEDLVRRARAAAKQLNLEYEFRFTGYGDMQSELAQFVSFNKTVIN